MAREFKEKAHLNTNIKKLHANWDDIDWSSVSKKVEVDDSLSTFNNEKSVDEKIHENALEYTKNHPYAHVIADDWWYRLTEPYKAYVIGAKWAMDNLK
jgi:hypothetical protein